MNGPADYVLEAECVKITFRWKEDRYEHAITAGELSCESTAVDDCATPVFTEIHRQDNVLFLSGMSGEGYWSATVEPTANGLRFDIALRLKSAATELASCYTGDTACLKPLDDAEHVCLRIKPRGFTPKHLIPPVTIRYCYQVAAE